MTLSKPTSKSVSRITSRSAPATPGPTPSTNRAISACSSPATTPNISAIHGLRPTSTAPTSSAPTSRFVVPNTAKAHSLASYITNDWHLTGTGILQSGEPYSLYEFYGAVGSINFGNYPNLANPVLGIKNPKNPKSAMTGNSGKFRGGCGILHPDPRSQPDFHRLPQSRSGWHSHFSRRPASDIYETAWNKGERNIFRQAGQKRIDLSLRKSFHFTEKIGLQYEFDAFNVFNTTSLDIPQDQAQIRQNYACSDSANAVSYNNCALGYVNYGQIVDQRRSRLISSRPFTTWTRFRTPPGQAREFRLRQRFHRNARTPMA